MQADKFEAEKVDVSRVWMLRSESSESRATVTSMEAANQVLSNWMDLADENDSTHCDVRIVFEDGFQYRGRLHLNKGQKRISLARHVRKQLNSLANSKLNSHVQDEEPEISMIGPDVPESAKLALEQYNI